MTEAQSKAVLDLAGDPKTLADLTLAIKHAVRLSAYGDKGYTRDQAEALINSPLVVPGTAAALTGNEIDRRVNICYDWFLTLKSDCHWSIPKILDHLAHALRCRLDGIPWDPKTAATEGRWATPATI